MRPSQARIGLEHSSQGIVLSRAIIGRALKVIERHALEITFGRALESRVMNQDSNPIASAGEASRPWRRLLTDSNYMPLFLAVYKLLAIG
jgi:hypothetical protein